VDARLDKETAARQVVDVSLIDKNGDTEFRDGNCTHNAHQPEQAGHGEHTDQRQPAQTGQCCIVPRIAGRAVPPARGTANNHPSVGTCTTPRIASCRASSARFTARRTHGTSAVLVSAL
jgi:hypothetical protein